MQGQLKQQRIRQGPADDRGEVSKEKCWHAIRAPRPDAPPVAGPRKAHPSAHLQHQLQACDLNVEAVQPLKQALPQLTVHQLQCSREAGQGDVQQAGG